MENQDLTRALMKVHGLENPQGGRAPLRRETGGAVGAGLAGRMRRAVGAETGAVIGDAEKAQALQGALEDLEQEKLKTTDPDELKALERMIEAASVGAAAPLGEMATQIQSQGRGEDTSLAHLRPGEVIIPPEAFEDAEFESVVSKKFNELGIDPETMVSSVGIASLNPITGLEEFGFFKKLVKGVGKIIKKVVRPIARVAQFIPGPWQPIAGIINKVGTVVDVAKGKVSPLALLTVAGPLRVGPSIGESFEAIKGASATGGFWSGLGQSFKDMPGALSKGVGSLLRDPYGTAQNLFRSQNPADYVEDSSGNWVNMVTGEGLPRGITDPAQMLSRSGSGIQNLTRGVQGNLFGREGIAGGVTQQPGGGGQYEIQPGDTLEEIAAKNGMTVEQLVAANPSVPYLGGKVYPGQFLNMPGAGGQYEIKPGDTLSQIAAKNGMTVAQLMEANKTGPNAITDPNMIYAGQTLNIPGAGQPTYQDAAGNIFTQEKMREAGFVDAAGKLTPRAAGQFIPGQAAGQFAPGFGGQQVGGMFGGQGGGLFGGQGGLASLAAAGIPAYLLGKMAYDEAKSDRGVPLTPLTTMGPTGRYNIEAEIARRMGTQSPNPIEYGLLPRGTIPRLSGGQPMTAARGGAVYPMAYADGGNVSMDEFNRMNGAIAGGGTETSDSIPAMLSDGEFVMTGEAVRGAGGYDLNNQAGILTLVPSGAPDKENGTNLMYEMMGLFTDYVGDARSVANA